jgi:phosphohistidine phosphatase SixA
MRIFLVRHAQAAPGDPDELRPLTPEGEAAADELAERLAAEQPTAVISSPLLRARQTADRIAEAAGLEAEVDERIAPGATSLTLREAVEERGGTVVAVGHQPDCSEIVLKVTGRRVSFAPAHVEELRL